ncbi:hypothetical protein QAD02_009629 [Eretmocerus hayati]|uniref:Uncharacterized protein n=1 Tax=Eretmocerus hayati TaxID=131215 RepID=A0ACC2NAM7_9HYME|nr:hypothetical protein QAD02_009629 [Eretmocerus hayati]
MSVDAVGICLREHTMMTGPIGAQITLNQDLESFTLTNRASATEVRLENFRRRQGAAVHKLHQVVDKRVDIKRGPSPLRRWHNFWALAGVNKLLLLLLLWPGDRYY